MLQLNPIIHRLPYKGYRLSMLRLDLIHREVSGNKWFKLKYNLLRARALGKDTILTFGGAFSNHIAATAFACKQEGFKSIGIIRGEDSARENPTLLAARANGMELLFVSREAYKQKEDAAYLQALSERFPNAWIVPEGGDNAEGQQGCETILSEATNDFTHIFCAYGTGTTFKGMARTLRASQKLTGIHVLKYEAASDLPGTEVLNAYHFGGYARHTQALLDFKTWFEKEFGIVLDYVYTAKLCYAVFDLINKGQIAADEHLLIVHSGGLQGNAGYEARYSLNPSRQVNEPQG